MTDHPDRSQPAATEKPFGSVFTLSRDPRAGSGHEGSDLTAGGGLPMFRSRPARLIPPQSGRILRQPIGFR